jgi:hypothetical protein
LPLISSTLTSAPLTGAAKIEPLIVVGVVDGLSLELLQAAIIPTEQATVVFNIRDFMFKVIHHLEFDNLKSV